MPKEILAIGLTLFVHIVGLVALIWALLLNDDDRPDWRSWWPGDEDDAPPDPAPSPPGDALPLGDALPARVRLRAPARIADGYRRPARRPEHVPEREPAPR